MREPCVNDDRASCGACRWMQRMVIWGVALVAGIALGGGVAAMWKHHRAEAAENAPDAAEKPGKVVFESTLAGTWYPGTQTGLNQDLANYWAEAEQEPLADVAALILPHAGYRYSGQTAVYGLKALAGQTYDRVIVIGPTHSTRLPNMCSVPLRCTHFSTPLGETALDVDFLNALAAHPEFKAVPEAIIREHSVQIELPLLQKALGPGSFRFVPVVAGQLDAGAARRVAAILRGLIDGRTLVVASTDFTHYGPDYDFVPFKDNVADNLKQMDMGAWDSIAKRDLDGFYTYLNESGATVCGRCSIGVLLAMLPETFTPHLLRYDTSGQLLNDFTNSVSYVAAAFTGAWPKGEPEKMAGSMEVLPEADKEALLKLARTTLGYAVAHGGRAPSLAETGIALTPGLKQVMGAFVTLKKQGDLRGCIGEIFPRRPIYETVMDEAINAAFNDPRFNPVSASEVPELDIEISAYAEGPRPVNSYNDIVLGKHGIVLEKGGRRALFLPQVAPEQGWNLDETLTHLAMKAGLRPDAWKEGTSFSVFEAIVFGEKE